MLYTCITHSNEKYKRKQEARKRQEEEEKVKVAHFHERENKLKFETVQRLTSYLKITDAVLDEDDVVLVEEKLALPELTPEMQVCYNCS
jgi:hypothetical protein